MCHTHGVVRRNQFLCASWRLNLHMRLLVLHFGLRDAAAYLIIEALILVHSVLLKLMLDLTDFEVDLYGAF